MRIFGLVLLLASSGTCFYLPGVSPRVFKDQENVNMRVQALISTEKPLQYDYYQLPFCKPEKVRGLGLDLKSYSLNRCK
jgi:transmembrane 9 superfamily member 2/4